MDSVGHLYASDTGFPDTFDLLGYFNGRVAALGVIEDRFGVCRRKLFVNVVGVREGSHLKLKEQFVFDDGEKQQRTWWIEKVDQHRFVGHADDTLGSAEGVIDGAQARWSYALKIPIGKRDLAVNFKDTMYLLPDDTLINRAIISKWGVTLGSVTLSFHRC